MSSEKRPREGITVLPFPSATSGGAVVVLPASAADLDFPNVVVSGLPSGFQIYKVFYILLSGALLDTSTAENQVDQAGKTIRVKKSTGDWAVAGDQMVALTFANLGLQTPASNYRGGIYLPGSTDLSSIVDGDGTYNFRSEETNNGEGVTVTGASLEILDAVSMLVFWLK